MRDRSSPRSHCRIMNPNEDAHESFTPSRRPRAGRSPLGLHQLWPGCTAVPAHVDTGPGGAGRHGADGQPRQRTDRQCAEHAADAECHADPGHQRQRYRNLPDRRQLDRQTGAAVQEPARRNHFGARQTGAERRGRQRQVSGHSGRRARPFRDRRAEPSGHRHLRCGPAAAGRPGRDATVQRHAAGL